MFADRKLKKGTGIYIFAVLLLVALFSYMGWSNWRDAQEKFLNEHTSATAVVVDKYIQEWRGGLFFYIAAEHEAVNQSGQKTTVIHKYHIPYTKYEEYLQIEVGDIINAYYVKNVGWSYLSFERTNEKREMVCFHCGSECDTPFCGHCGTPMNPEG